MYYILNLKKKTYDGLNLMKKKIEKKINIGF